MGFLESVIIILIVGFVSKRVAGKEKILDILTIVGAIAIVLTLIYIMLKPYPMDYADGKLLVDPQIMMNDTFKACGVFTGFLTGSFVDRHYLKYEIPVGARELPMLTFVGAAIMFGWLKWFAPATIVAAFGGHWGNMISSGIMVFFAMCVWPLFITKVCGQKD